MLDSNCKLKQDMNTNKARLARPLQTMHLLYILFSNWLFAGDKFAEHI